MTADYKHVIEELHPPSSWTGDQCKWKRREKNFFSTNFQISDPLGGKSPLYSWISSTSWQTKIRTKDLPCREKLSDYIS